MEGKEKRKKKSLVALKSMATSAKSWGNKLSPKMQRKRVKSKVALMKVRWRS